MIKKIIFIIFFLCEFNLEIYAQISPPTLISPGSSSSPGPTINTLTPTFQWQSVSGATGYGLYIRDMTTNTLVFDSDNSYPNGISGTSFTISSGILQWGRQYRWNMRSRSSSGWGTQFSSPYYFQTATSSLQISNLLPNPVIGSNFKQTVTINGSGFLSGATVTWRDKTFNQTYPDRQPIYISNNEIRIEPIFGTDPSNWTAQVKNPDGQTSNEFAFNVHAPVPVIESLNPNSIVAGGPSFELTVNGNTFHRGSKVKWNNSDRTTTPILDNSGKTIGLKAQILASDIITPGTAQITVYSPGPGGGNSNTVNFIINSSSSTQINLSQLWPVGDFWKPKTYTDHSSSGKYFAVDFYYSNRNRPDIYLNDDIGISGRSILAPLSGDVYLHLLDVTTYSTSGNFPYINAVRVIQGLDSVPKNCFSMVDSLGVTKNIDLSLIIRFSSTSRASFSHLKIKEQYFNSNVIQKIRDAIRRFYNRSASGQPMRVAISTGFNVSTSEVIGFIDKYGIALQPHLHFQIFQSSSDYSESNPILGSPIDLSDPNKVLLNGQQIFEYEGIYSTGNISYYHYPAMPRRSFTMNQAIVVNASWDGGSSANLRDSPAGGLLKSIQNGTIGTILNSSPVVAKLNNRIYLWYNVKFGNDIGWMVADYFDALATSIEDNNLVPTNFVLRQNFPNPFNNETKISFSLPENAFVNLAIYNINGEKVQEILNENLEKGIYEFNVNFASFSSGIYIYRIYCLSPETGQIKFTASKKLVLIK